MTFKKALFATLTIASFVSATSPSSAQSLQRVSQPSNQTFDNQTASYNLDLSQFLEVPGVTGQIVILESSVGNIAFEMLPSSAPKTVANFLSYVKDGSYDNNMIHRSVPGFIIQGGGFKATIPIEDVPPKPPVVNEFDLSNTRGTVAMAKLGGDPNSATNGWFINLANNSGNLDNQNGGFTVFARVIGSGMSIADTIAGYPIWNAGSAFTDLPLDPAFDGSRGILVNDFVSFPSVHEAELFPTTNTSPSFASYSAITSSNPVVASATLDDIDINQLHLTLGQGATGSSDISVTASDINGNTVELSFTITLEDAYLSLDSGLQELSYLDSSYLLSIDSNTVWQAENLPSWVRLSSNSGDGSEQLTVTVSKNEASTPRSATFTINEQTHTVRQRSDFNGWLASHFTSNEIAAMTPDIYTADSDSDGLSNLVENTLGLDPSDPNSRLASRLEFDGSTYTLIYAPYSDLVTHNLSSSEDLSTWSPTNATPETTENTVRFQIPAENSPQTFYQLVIESSFFATPAD